MVTYTLECPDELWYEWTDTVPRSTNLDDKLCELIQTDLEAETDG